VAPEGKRLLDRFHDVILFLARSRRVSAGHGRGGVSGSAETNNPASAFESVAGQRSRCGRSLLAQAEALDERAVRLDLAALQVIELAAALAHHPQQAAARMEILDVRLEMLGEHVDAL